MIGVRLGASENIAQFVVTAYLLGFALGQIPIGFIADRFGRRPVIFICLGIFTLAAVVGAMTDSIQFLLGARFVQGLSGAAGGVAARAIVRDIGGRNSAALMALMTSILGLAPLLAPLIGGVLVEALGWRATVAANAAYGALTIVMIAFFLPETLGSRPGETAFRQLTGSVRGLLASRQSIAGILLVCFPFAGYLAMITSASTVLMQQYGVSPKAFGAIFALAAVAYSGGAILARKLLARHPEQRVLAGGVAVLGVAGGVILAAAILRVPPLWMLWSGVMLFILGLSITAPVATSLALAPLPQSAGFAASIIGAAQIAAGVIGSTLSASYYAGDENSMAIVMAVSAALTISVYALWGHSEKPKVMSTDTLYAQRKENA